MLKSKLFLFFIFLFFLLLLFNVNGAVAKTAFIHVKVEGLVTRPGVYKLKYGSKLSSLLQEIWPLKRKADLKNAFLLRRQLEIDRKVELRGLLREIEHLKGLNRFVKREIKIQFLKLKASGRIVIHLKNPILLLNTKDDIKLKNNDVILIKGKPDSVFVEGAVKNPGKYNYRKDKTYGYYLNDAHGAALNKAAFGYLYIIKATGGIQKISTNFIVWNKKKKIWEFALFEKPIKINAGDIIFVPFNYGGITNKLTRLILDVYRMTGTLLNYEPQ